MGKKYLIFSLGDIPWSQLKNYIWLIYCFSQISSYLPQIPVSEDIRCQNTLCRWGRWSWFTVPSGHLGILLSILFLIYSLVLKYLLSCIHSNSFSSLQREKISHCPLGCGSCGESSMSLSQAGGPDTPDGPSTFLCLCHAMPGRSHNLLLFPPQLEERNTTDLCSWIPKFNWGCVPISGMSDPCSYFALLYYAMLSSTFAMLSCLLSIVFSFWLWATFFSCFTYLVIFQ